MIVSISTLEIIDNLHSALTALGHIKYIAAKIRYINGVALHDSKRAKDYFIHASTSP
jgi:hypothetical protein